MNFISNFPRRKNLYSVSCIIFSNHVQKTSYLFFSLKLGCQWFFQQKVNIQLHTQLQNWISTKSQLHIYTLFKQCYCSWEWWLNEWWKNHWMSKYMIKWINTRDFLWWMESFKELGAICNREHIWLHVDAAYAGFFSRDITITMVLIQYKFRVL